MLGREMEGSILTLSFAKIDTMTKNKEHKARSFCSLVIFVQWKETRQTWDWAQTDGGLPLSSVGLGTHCHLMFPLPARELHHLPHSW